MYLGALHSSTLVVLAETGNMLLDVNDDEAKTVLDLGLDRDEDDEEEEDHPRRLLKIPATGELLAYGGEVGAVVKINNDNSTTTLIRHWDEDDDVRAVAISTDSTKIAIGFDSGSTVIYKYSPQEVSDAGNLHPFVTTKPSRNHETIGPVFQGSVRDLHFCGDDNNLLAVATEEGGCVLDLDTFTRRLETDIQKQHDGSGIRGIAVKNDILATLAMDGRLCLWNVKTNSLIQRESGRCVTKKDVGELLGADAWDRACRPHLITMQDDDDSSLLLALPGETYLQLRKISSSSSNDDTTSIVDYDQPPTDNTPVHIESIVALAAVPTTTNDNTKYLISSGRDKRVILWKINTEKVTRTNNVTAF